MTTPAAATPEESQAQPKPKPPPVKQGRIIVRNLVFDVREKHLLKAFQKFGKVTSLNVPLNNANNQNRGFGFVEFPTRQEAQKAIDAMNGAQYKGRPLTVEFSLPKTSYETKVQHVLDNTNQTKQEAVKPKSVKIEQKVKEQKQKEAEDAKPKETKKEKKRREKAEKVAAASKET